MANEKQVKTGEPKGEIKSTASTAGQQTTYKPVVGPEVATPPPANRTPDVVTTQRIEFVGPEQFKQLQHTLIVGMVTNGWLARGMTVQTPAGIEGLRKSIEAVKELL
jgi:hypothetical protein